MFHWFLYGFNYYPNLVGLKTAGYWSYKGGRVAFGFHTAFRHLAHAHTGSVNGGFYGRLNGVMNRIYGHPNMLPLQ